MSSQGDTVYLSDAASPIPSAGPLPGRTDVLIVGGGFTGLSAALHLARAGRSVTLCEADALANGASGRNGGQLHPGQRQDQDFLDNAVGRNAADALWRLGEEAVALVHTLRAELNAPCDYRPGLISAAHTQAEFDDLKHYADRLKSRYGTEFEVLDSQDLADAIGTQRYVGGIRDGDGGHLNPLALAGALAFHAHLSGAHLHAPARVTAVERSTNGFRVHVSVPERGKVTVQADTVILAGNGYMAGLEPRVESRIIPLQNFIIATAPLDTPVIPGGEAVSDTRYVIRYFRQDAAGRMVFGGGEAFTKRPRDIARFVRPYLREVYPQLGDIPIEAAWAGTLAVTLTRCPMITELERGLYVGAGYSGQGVGIATFAGKVIADAIVGDDGRLRAFEAMPVPKLPGGSAFRVPLAQLGMAWFALRDRLGV